ncbi:MAG TPA: spermine synthase, partial [Candidatus Latescibacteria bacterium]|nr:spermine synthase [Candidatus Latescibacterota bacterium]
MQVLRVQHPGHLGMTLAIWVMGFSGIVAQVLLLRELLIVFSGNELSIGIILANWLVLEAAGSFLLGKKIESSRKKLEAYVLVQTIFSFALPLAVYWTRSLRGAIGAVPGEGFGLSVIFYSSLLLLLPVSLPHGALFTFGCRLYAEAHRRPASWAVGRVYLYETLGTIVGGIVLVYFMVPYLHSVRIALIVALLNLAVCPMLLKPFRQGIISVGTSAALVAVGYVLFGRGADQVHRLSVKRQWQCQKVVYYGNSIYGNIAVLEKEGQYTFFSNGVPVVAAPVPDIAFVEEFVHIPMLSHPEPKEVLILSGGAGGVIREVLKHPTVRRIDYAELDPMLLKVVRRFAGPAVRSELDDPRVHVHNMDGRLFVRRSPHEYDLIFIGLRDPSNLQVNRLFTEEFFLSAEGKLGRRGILVLGLPGSLTYISEELRDLNACILKTLEAVYPHIRIIPGDLNLYLTSPSPEVSRVTPSLLASRMRERSLEVSLLTPGYLRYRLHRRWLDWFSTSMEGARGGNNEDFAPLAVFRSLSHWNAIFAPSLRGWFGRLEGIGLGHIFPFLL